MLKEYLRCYHKNAIKAAQIIKKLIDLAEREEALNLIEDETASYDTLETNDSAVKVIPCGQFKGIYWTVRESVFPQMSVLVKRILRYRTSRRRLLRQC